jgi:hypothetical protein
MCKCEKNRFKNVFKATDVWPSCGIIKEEGKRINRKAQFSISWRENNQQMIFRIYPTHRRKIFNSYAESFHFMEGR